jgi:hypothetical protein
MQVQSLSKKKVLKRHAPQNNQKKKIKNKKIKKK